VPSSLLSAFRTTEIDNLLTGNVSILESSVGDGEKEHEEAIPPPNSDNSVEERSAGEAWIQAVKLRRANCDGRG
jgi:hypothetical protein